MTSFKTHSVKQASRYRKALDPAVFQSTLRDAKADAGFDTWVSARQFDPYQLFHSDSAKNRGSNYYNFRNSEADAIMEQARPEFDAEKRKQLYWRFQEIFHEEQPYTLLYYPKDAAAYHVRFQNVQFLQSGRDMRLPSGLLARVLNDLQLQTSSAVSATDENSKTKLIGIFLTLLYRLVR